MLPTAFDYYRPTSLENALATLSEHGDDAKVLAGGHSLIPAMRLRLSQPGVLVDIGGLRDQLSFIKEEDGMIKIGAMTTHYQVESSELLKDKAPILPEAAGVIGDPAVRNWGTIGGSAVHADPSSDGPAVLLALDAEFVLVGPSGERVVPAREFFVDILTTSIESNEIMTEIRFPTPEGTKMSYQKLANKASHYSVVGAAVVLTIGADGTIERANVGFSGLAATPIRADNAEAALAGASTDGDSIAAAVKGCADDVDALADLHGSADYRKAMAEVYAKRAIQAALSR